MPTSKEESMVMTEIEKQDLHNRWALILGASSGFGAAAARGLARAGMNIFGVHLDPRSTIERAEVVISDIEATGRRARFFNTNAADARRRGRVVRQIAEELATPPHGSLHLLVHSLAFGSLRPFIAEEPGDETTEAQLEMTFRVMAHSLVYWTQDLVRADLLQRGSRIYALTSAGSERVISSYGAVSGAKAALESHARQLALELAPRGIAVNCLLPGAADTPALRAIPEHEQILAAVHARHPAGRMTTPEDVAQALVALADPRLTWISGAIIPVDGGERIVGVG
jgi:NAD(P)-dependent dehydrogenase (short-subunit alcohol dehydrogenase family)